MKKGPAASGAAVARRARRCRRWGIALSCWVAAACAPSKPAPAPVARVPAPARPPPVAAQLTPLSLPEDVVLVGRWLQPQRLLGKLAEWSRGTASLEPWLLGRVGQPSGSVDLARPIELLVRLERKHGVPRLAWATSIALAGASPGLAQGPRDVTSLLGWACAEARALGSAPARVVCAATDEDLRALLPYATRAVPLAALGDADLTLALRSRPLRQLEDALLAAAIATPLSQALGVGDVNARFDEQFADLVQSLALELRNVAEDLDGASLELRVAPASLEVAVFAPAWLGRSAFGHLLRGAAGQSGLAPAGFWQVHRESENAGYIWGFEPTRLARLRQPVADVLGTVLDYRGVPELLIRQARDLVEGLPVPRGPLIHAAGSSPAARAAPPNGDQRRQAQRRWHVVNFTGNFAQYRFYVAELVKAFRDPILGPQFLRLLRSALGRSRAPVRLSQRPPRGGALPSGSFTLEVGFAPQPAAATGLGATATGTAATAATGATATSALPTLYVLFLPDDDGVEIAWGSDERFLISLVEKPRPSASSTLAGRAGLGSLHRQRTLAGGFYSLAALDLNGPSALPWSWLGDHQPAAIDSAPHRGRSPIVYRLSEGVDAAAPLFSASLGRDTLEDVSYLLTRDGAAR